MKQIIQEVERIKDGLARIGLGGDLISRQALCEYALNQKDKSVTPNDIMRFPSAQPETHEERTETRACDLIDRQAAIDAVAEGLKRIFVEYRDVAEKMLNKVPSAQPEVTEEAVKDYCRKRCLTILTNDYFHKLTSAQPEIIRCHECKHMQEDKIFHQYWCNGNEVKPDHFCGYAERRQDE